MNDCRIVKIELNDDCQLLIGEPDLTDIDEDDWDIESQVDDERSETEMYDEADETGLQ